MDIQIIFSIVLAVSLTLMFAQLTVINKRAVHIVFAIFSGSIAMMAATTVAAGESKLVAYLIGLGACATCNGFWLVARALFRGPKALTTRHILFAASVAVLLVCKQSLFFWQDVLPLTGIQLDSVSKALGELVNLLSSAMLVLTFWEGCRGWRHTHGQQRIQRMLFLSTFGGGVLLCTVVAAMLPTSAVGYLIHQYFIGASALSILFVTQWLISRQSAELNVVNTSTPISSSLQAKQKNHVERNCYAPTDNVLTAADSDLARQINDVLFKQKLFLQANLKVGDVAKSVDSPEYKVSRILRHQFNARNFNHFINNLRIKHAKTLLEDLSNENWPILVIGLESGFASVGPFTRAFKSVVGSTPNEYRQNVARQEIVRHKLAQN